MAEWHRVHDFLHGFGMKEHIPDNEIVISEREGGEGKDGVYRIPVRYVRHRQEERYVWLRDSHRLLGIDIFADGVDLDDVYDRLEPLLSEERRLRREKYEKEGPARFTKITIPKVNRPFPQL